jgi:hypothetical protein
VAENDRKNTEKATEKKEGVWEGAGERGIIPSSSTSKRTAGNAEIQDGSHCRKLTDKWALVAGHVRHPASNLAAVS